MSTRSRLSALEKNYEARTLPPVLAHFPDGTEKPIGAMDMKTVLTSPRGTTFSSPDGKLSIWAATLTAIAAGNPEA